MALFNSLEHTTNTAIKKGETFLKNSEQYYKLKTFQVVTLSISLLVKATIIGLFLLIAFIFIAVALSNVISDYLNNKTLGYLLVALLYVVFAIITYILRKSIENSIIKNLSKNFFDDEEHV